MKSLFALFVLVPGMLLARPSFYRVTIDLVDVRNDMVKVVVTPPEIQGESFRYIMPRSVPGTYSQDNYGRFLTNPVAFDASGAVLNLTRDSGDVVITGKLARLEYWVRDTWDDPEAADVFQPTGSNIQKDTNYVINTHAFVGYFDGHKMDPYEVTVRKPRGFYGATSLDRLELNDTTDVLSAKTYPRLVDNPIMYCVPDTVSFMQNNMNVMVAVYSPNKKVSARVVADELQPLSAALGKFFGVMPVTRYTFIFYFADLKMFPPSHRFTYGALEHSYSSFYFLLEGGGLGAIKESIRSTAGHEFLHILVPLNLHSEEIHDFDFKSPKMSQHLWLYEGCTEYFSLLNRAQDTLLTEKEFFDNLMQKIRSGEQMTRGKTFSMTKFSRNVLTKENQQLYPIVYESGAALAFCFDLRIREVSGNKLDLLSVIRKLSAEYGPDKPFKDDELFDEIANLVGPDIRSFIDDYIIGEKPVPFQDYFNRVGYSYKDSTASKGYQFSAARIFFKRIPDAVVLSVRSDNDFKIVDGDTLVRINDIQVTPDNKFEMLSMFVWSPKNEKEVTLTVRRNGSDVKLTATPVEKMITRHNVVEPLEQPADIQVMFRKSLLKKS